MTSDNWTILFFGVLHTPQYSYTNAIQTAFRRRADALQTPTHTPPYNPLAFEGALRCAINALERQHSPSVSSFMAMPLY